MDQPAKKKPIMDESETTDAGSEEVAESVKQKNVQEVTDCNDIDLSVPDSDRLDDEEGTSHGINPQGIFLGFQCSKGPIS